MQLYICTFEIVIYTTSCTMKMSANKAGHHAAEHMHVNVHISCQKSINIAKLTKKDPLISMSRSLIKYISS